MIYQHQNFVVNTDSRKVFDENGKELYLTGNAYRMLVFLCAKKQATLTDIGSQFDWAKNYDENNIRQYRYKINSIISRPIIEYKNGIYSLSGEVKELDKMPENQRNTVLLHPHHLNWEGMKNTLQFSKWPAAIAALVLLLTFFRMPYSYYSFLRFVVTIVAAYYAYYLLDVEKKQDGWFWSLVVIAIAFNPFFPVYLGKKSTWQGIDLLVVIFLIILIFKLGKVQKPLPQTNNN